MGSKEEAIDFIFKNHPDPDTLFIGDKKYDSNTIQNISSLMAEYANEKTKQQREVLNFRLKNFAQLVKDTIEDSPAPILMSVPGYKELLERAESLLKEIQ